jgi:NADH-quinone oxidoreductase subunit N
MSFPDLNLAAFGPELVLSVAALVVLLLGAFRHEGRFATALSIAFIVWAFVWWWRISPSEWAFGGDYGGDGVSYFARGFFILAAFAMTVLTSTSEALGKRNKSEFAALLYISVVGMMVMASAHNWVMIFLGLETMSVPLYVMAAFVRDERASVEAGVKYFLYGAFASAFFVYGIALVYSATGTVDNVLLVESGPLTRVAAAGLVLIMVGLAFKIAAVPFHMWAPDAYTGAPTAVTAFFAVAPKAAGFVALYRLTVLSAQLAEPVMLKLLAVLAVLTIVFGNLWALVQNRVKRMLAYSSISHAGYLLLALVSYGHGGAEALLFYLIAYGLMTLGAFVVLLAYEKDGGGTTYEDLNGGATRRPILALMMTVFMVSLAGFPATAGFIGKLQIFRALLSEQRLALTLVAIAGSLVSVAYYLRVVVHLYMKPAQEVAAQHVPAVWTAMAVLLAVGVVAFGLFPDWIWPSISGWVQIASGGAMQAAP